MTSSLKGAILVYPPVVQPVILALTPETRGHGTHIVAAVWKQYLEELLAVSAR